MKTKPAIIFASLLKKLTAYFCTFILVLTAMHSLAQAPSFSYATPQTFNTGVTIMPLAPANTGGAVLPTLIDTLYSAPYVTGRVATDAAGNVYILDNGNIKKIPSGGGGPIVIATGLDAVQGITADAAGNVYIVDVSNSYNQGIKKIPANGGAIVTVGPTLDHPFAVAVDRSGNIYFTDNSGIKKMSADGGTPILLVSTNSGNSFFTALNVDDGGNIYYADFIAGDIKEKMTATGAVVVISSVSASRTETITGIAVDKYGNVYYSNGTDRYITRLRPATGEKDKIGWGIVRPAGIALDKTGRIYVGCDESAIVRITLRGYFINKDLPPGLSFDGNTGIISGTPTLPSVASNYTITASNHSGAASATVNLSVTATIKPSISYSNAGPFHQNNEITPLAPGNTGGAITTGNQKVLVPNLNSPSGVTVDRLGDVYYTESQIGDVKMIPGGVGKPVLIGSGFTAPLGVALDGVETVYLNVADGKSIALIGLGGLPVYKKFWSGKFNDKVIAADSSSHVYVARADIGAIMRYRADGSDPFRLALINFIPAGMATDRAGNLYITTTTGDIKEIKAGTSTIIDIASTNTQVVSAAVDDSGNVYYLEHTNNTLSMYLAATGKIVVLANGLSGSFGAAVDANRYVYVTGTSLSKITTSGYYIDKPLPAGLVMDKATGIISGSPTTSSVADTYTVTALNSAGISTSSFTLSVLGNSALAGLVPNVSHLAPSFTPEQLNYKTTVASSVTSITFTPTTADSLATVTVNGVTVASGTASAAIPLTTGDNAVHIIVTATNGSKTTYSVLVTRLASSNCYLATLLTSHGILSPTFTHLTNSYTTQVGAYVASLNVTPTTVDSTATITVNGTPLASGATSAKIPLTVGVNPINIAVTAQNGTVNTYIINVTRVPSTNAYLMRILLNHGYDVPLFSHLIFNYATPVPNGVSAIKVTPIGAVSSSTITVNGAVVVSGTASGDIPLTVGVNNITILVTAQDGVTQNTYTVTVTREPPSLNTVYQPVGVATTNGLDGLAGNDVLVHSGLSPNGDGINDFLLIDGIANYPENKLQVMTRNGQLIFEAKNYDNSTKVFDGHSNKNGTMQLPGTYFYSLDYTVNGVVKHKTGFVVIKY